MPDDLYPRPCDFSTEREPIRMLARLWAEDPCKPQPSRDSLRYWDRLLHDWSNGSRLPLFIRKQKLGRGSILNHSFGRRLVPTDNSPPHWIFGHALAGHRPTANDIDSQIPVAFTFVGDENPDPRYNRTLSPFRRENSNAELWHVAHIDEIGLTHEIRT